MEGVLGQLASLPGQDRRLRPSAYADLLAAALAQAVCPSQRPGGAILAASVMDMRTVPARHVWLAGLNEGVFPAAFGPRLLSETDRHALGAKGVGLDLQDDLASRELLLFYLAISRAQESLTVSWLCDDGDGRELAPSPFVAELVSPLGGLAGRVMPLPTAQFAPPPHFIASRQECFNLALSTLADRQGPAPQAAMSALGQVARAWPKELQSLAWPLWSAYRRWTRGPSDAYDGRIDDPALLAELARRFGPAAVFSVSQINTYLTCRWRYFAQRLLKLEELPEPEEALLPRQRGILVHSVLCRLMRRLIGTPAADRAAWAGQHARDALEAALDHEASAVRPAGAAGRALWQIELQQIREIILAYLRRQSELPLPAGQVRHAELAFGMGAAADTDRASAPEPFRLETAGRPILLRGKIDRVDVLVGPENTQRLFVVDYKTGELPKPTEDVQLPVYIAAAKHLTGLPAAGGAFHALRAGRLQERYLASFGIGRNSLAENERFESQLDEGLSLVSNAVAGMAGGDFDIFTEFRCPQGSCPYRRICGHSEVRGLFKLPAADEPEVAHE
jgi:RecB family exonuclease